MDREGWEKRMRKRGNNRQMTERMTERKTEKNDRKNDKHFQACRQGHHPAITDSGME